MSDRVIFAVPSDLRARIARDLPQATGADFAALAILITADKFVTDDGVAHPAFVNWVAGIIARGDGLAGASVLSPPPRPVPQSGFVGASA